MDGGNLCGDYSVDVNLLIKKRGGLKPNPCSDTQKLP